MTDLEKMFEFQKSFQEKLYGEFAPENMTYEEKVEKTKQYCLYLYEEVTEVMQSLKHKKHHVYDNTYTIEATHLEIIDCLKYVLNLAILWGLNSKETAALFDIKSIENLRRLEMINQLN